MSFSKLSVAALTLELALILTHSHTLAYYAYCGMDVGGSVQFSSVLLLPFLFLLPSFLAFFHNI